MRKHIWKVYTHKRDLYGAKRFTRKQDADRYASEMLAEGYTVTIRKEWDVYDCD